MKTKIRNFFRQFDLFPASPTLRAQSNSQVTNFCNGILSFLLFTLFLYIFITNIISTIQLQNITSIQLLQANIDNDQDLLTIDNITLAIGLQKYNLTNLTNILELHAFIIDQNDREYQLETFPCGTDRQYWKQISDVKYKLLGIDQFICVRKQESSVYGVIGAQKFRQLYINLSVCSNATSQAVCAGVGEIDAFFAMDVNRFLACSFLVLDTLINPDHQDPISYGIYQQTLWLYFNRYQQAIVQLFLGTYEITTDTNFLPFTTLSKLDGYYVTQAIQSVILNPTQIPVLVECYVYGSPIKNSINRVYGKFDGVLSYVGGLYGIVVSIFAFFLLSFNQYKYELRVSQGAFSMNYCNSKLARQSQLNFFKYLKYSLYTWLKTLFSYRPTWQDCQAIDQARQQANQQIDVKHLLKRIAYLEKIIRIFVTKNGNNSRRFQSGVGAETQILLHLVSDRSIEEVRSQRKIVEYCEKFREYQVYETIANFDHVHMYGNTEISNYSDGKQVSKMKIQNNLHYTQQSLIHQEQQKPIEDLNQTPTKKHQQSNQLPNHQIKQQPSPQNTINSLSLMQHYLQKYKIRHNVPNSVSLSHHSHHSHHSHQSHPFPMQLCQQDLQIEQKLRHSFFNCPEQIRIRLIRDIPLGILYRLNLDITQKNIVKPNNNISNEDQPQIPSKQYLKDRHVNSRNSRNSHNNLHTDQLISPTQKYSKKQKSKSKNKNKNKNRNQVTNLDVSRFEKQGNQ